MCQQYKPKLKEFVQNSMTVLKVFIILCPFQWLLLDFQNMHFFFLIYLRTNISLEFLFYTRLVFLKLKELRLHSLFFNIIIIIILLLLSLLLLLLLPRIIITIIIIILIFTIIIINIMLSTSKLFFFILLSSE